MLLEGKNLVKSYETKDMSGKRKILNALNCVDFSLQSGEFCVLVGESGSGKSTLSRILAGITPPTSGEITLDGEDIVPKSKKRSKGLCKKIQLVLQDGKSSLDPHFCVYDLIAEPIQNLNNINKTEEKTKVLSLMEKMELPYELLKRKPSQLSGGQQKRVCIARALAAEPQIIIFDEAVSGLDVIVRKNILDLLIRLHEEENATYLFITHDMDVALYLATRILVMKQGEIVEQVYNKGDISCFKHLYSRLLLDAMVPTVNLEREQLYKKTV